MPYYWIIVFIVSRHMTLAFLREKALNYNWRLSKVLFRLYLFKKAFMIFFVCIDKTVISGNGEIHLA